MMTTNESEEEFEAKRQAVRENAKHVLRESGLAEMLRAINKDQLKGRGKFEEYDSMVLFNIKFRAATFVGPTQQVKEDGAWRRGIFGCFITWCCADLFLYTAC